MGLPNVFRTGVSGMLAHKASIATTGHNISNTETEGFSRQRVQHATHPAVLGIGKNVIGTGVKVARTERINDEYVEKQIRNANKDLSHYEEKDLVLRQTEDIFNEMNGDGLNRLVARFFNEFRRLANEPDNEAVRQSVREASQAMVNDFHRLRTQVEEVRNHIDSRLEAYTGEINRVAEEVKNLNIEVRKVEILGASANDLKDKRDLAVKKLATFMDIATHKDNQDNYIVDIKGVGPLVVGPNFERFATQRTPADEQGKADNSVDIKTTSSAMSQVTHQIKGGKLGALLEVRDQTLTTILDRLDELAYELSNAVNDIHVEGFTRTGVKGVEFFKQLDQKDRASAFIGLSDAVKSNVNNIAAAAMPDAPGDNRIAIALSGLQSMKLFNDGHASADDFYNSIVSDVGVVTNRNRAGINQQKDIVTQLGKMRDQISGASIDEETTNLMQFQHAYAASAKVIQVADDMLKTVLELKR